MSMKDEKRKGKNFLFISPKIIRGGARLIDSDKDEELYENMNDNTLKFAEEVIYQLITDANNKDESNRYFNFNLIFCGDFNDLDSDIENPIELIMHHKDKIVAVYKFVNSTEERKFFIGVMQTETIYKYGYLYFSLAKLLEIFDKNGIACEIDFNALSKDDTSTRFLIRYSKKNKLENEGVKTIPEYSQDEINQILLSKPLDEFYLAIVENRQGLITESEYSTIKNGDQIICGQNKDDILDLFNMIQTTEPLKYYSSDLMRAMYSLAQVRHMSILTIIGDEVYDICNARFENLKRNKIIHYDNLTNYYNETNARIKAFTPQEYSQLTQNTVLIDVDDVGIIKKYENDHLYQNISDDLTTSFFRQVKGRSYALEKEEENFKKFSN